MRKLVFVLLMVFLVACVKQQASEPETIIKYVAPPVQNTTEEVQDDCSLISDSNKADICYLNEAQKKKNVSFCEQVKGWEKKIYCFTQIAIITKKPEPCTKINSDYYRDDCYANVAKITNNYVICGSLIYNDKRDACYLSLNLSGKDPSMCSTLWTKKGKAECRAYFD